MSTKILLIVATLISSASALAIQPETVFDCKAGKLGWGGSAQVDEDAVTGNFVLSYGGREYTLARGQYQDDTCPAPSVLYRGAAQDGSEAVFYGDLKELRGSDQKLSFDLMPKGAKAKTVTLNCKSAQ